jgi:hypothetical protein
VIEDGIQTNLFLVLAVQLLGEKMAKYIPANVSAVVKETGAHFMCVIKKAIARGIDLRTATVEQLRPLAEECVREEKLVPVLKVLRKAGLR